MEMLQLQLLLLERLGMRAGVHGGVRLVSREIEFVGHGIVGSWSGKN
jgi:hypothetical protein